MTIPAARNAVALPPAEFPMLVSMFTDNLEKPTSGDPVMWGVSKSHPHVPGMNIVRMFIGRGGVEVYSASSDYSTCMRELIPIGRVRMTQETMPLDIFIAELAAAEAGDDDEDDDDPDDLPDGSEQPENPNGQVATS